MTRQELRLACPPRTLGAAVRTLTRLSGSMGETAGYRGMARYRRITPKPSTSTVTSPDTPSVASATAVGTSRTIRAHESVAGSDAHQPWLAALVHLCCGACPFRLRRGVNWSSRRDGGQPTGVHLEQRRRHVALG